MSWTLGFLGNLSDWIVGTRYSLFLQNVRGLVPVTQTLHIFAISILLSSAAIIDLRVLGLIGKAWSLQATLSRFMPAVWAALVALALTGMVLLSVEPGRSLLTLQFQMKMMLLAMALPLTVAIQHSVRANGTHWEISSSLPSGIQVLAIASMALWMAIIFAGRWIAYA